MPPKKKKHKIQGAYFVKPPTWNLSKLLHPYTPLDYPPANHAKHSNCWSSFVEGCQCPFLTNWWESWGNISQFLFKFTNCEHFFKGEIGKIEKLRSAASFSHIPFSDPSWKSPNWMRGANLQRLAALVTSWWSPTNSWPKSNALRAPLVPQ